MGAKLHLVAHTTSKKLPLPFVTFA